MTAEEQNLLTALNKKLDTILSILGHGRTKSDADLEREADSRILKWRMNENRKREKGRSS